MKYSISWLKELSQTKWTTDELVDNLTMRAFEVEKEDFDISEKVIIGEILEISNHPNADKLSLAKVDTGKEIQEIVCGAPNIKKGQKVPMALLGAILPNGIEIKEVEIRGIKSCGMLCAPDELGLGEDHSGILILDQEAQVGQTLKAYLELQERSLEIKVLPDRAHDALSHVGMAKEIAILGGKKIDYDFEGLILPNKKSKELKIKIEDKKLCPRYIGIVWKGVEVKESPTWIQKKLKDAGLRSINNIVDATNLIMLELGNPIHAFDLAQVKTEKNLQIIVRQAKKNEKIVLLDGEEKELGEEDLLITNQKEALALAGIKGGKKSGINEKTKDLVIEIANFSAVEVRKTRTKLGLATDASLRYEKDIDPNLCEKAALRVIDIIENIAGGELEGIVDKYPRELRAWEIELSINYVENLLGEKVPEKNIEKILNLLDIKFRKNNDKLICKIPTIRLDLKTQEDLIEEIGRIWGYKKVEARPIETYLAPVALSPIQKTSRKIRRILMGLGFSEVYNYSFYSKNDAKNLGISKEHAKIKNPADLKFNLFSASLLPNLIKNSALNLGNFENFSLFEIGKVYHLEGKDLKEDILIAGVIVISKKQNELDSFLNVKGKLEVFFQELNISSRWEESNCLIKIIAQDKVLGILQKIENNIQERFEIKRFSGSIYAFEINLQSILEVERKNKTYREILKFPSVLRDISFLVPKNSNYTFEKIRSLIKKSGGKNLAEVDLFDIFKKENKTSYAFHLGFKSAEKTLKSEEVDESLQNIEKALEKEGFEIRK